MTAAGSWAARSHQRGVAAESRGDADRLEPGGEGCWLERAAWAQSGEQPVVIVGVAYDRPAALADVDQVEDQTAERFGKNQGASSEAEFDGAIGRALGDAVVAESGDAADGLGIEQNE